MTQQFRTTLSITITIAVLAIARIYFSRKKILSCLIILEIVILRLFLIVTIKFSQLNQPIAVCFYILIFGACEARLALRLLIIITRLKGNDILRSIRNYKY